MVFLLSLLSFIAVAAGVFGLGLGVPIRETSFGAAALVAGSVAVTGGFVLVGLAAAVRELRLLGQRFIKAPLSEMPRPVQPLERRDEERIEAAGRRPGPRMYAPVALRTEAADVISAKLDGRDAPERWRKPAREEWLRRAMAEIESEMRRAEAAPPSIDYHASDMRRPPKPWPGTAAIPLPPDHVDPELRRTSAVSSRDIFDLEAMWGSEHRSPEEGREPRTEQSPETGRRPVETRSPDLAPAHPTESASMRPVLVEPGALPILKSGVIRQMAYTLFTDGSIETQMREGVVRFASLEEFVSHLEDCEG